MTNLRALGLAENTPLDWDQSGFVRLEESACLVVGGEMFEVYFHALNRCHLVFDEELNGYVRLTSHGEAHLAWQDMWLPDDLTDDQYCDRPPPVGDPMFVKRGKRGIQPNTETRLEAAQLGHTAKIPRNPPRFTSPGRERKRDRRRAKRAPETIRQLARREAGREHKED